MEHFTPVPALIGGLMIGLATSLLLLFNGRIAGIAGILGAVVNPVAGDVAWRVWFIGGLLLGGSGLALVLPSAFVSAVTTPSWLVVVAGLLVGFGTRLGGGCTSGHGVCGNSRLSKRSILATITFIAAGAGAVLLRRALLGELA